MKILSTIFLLSLSLSLFAESRIKVMVIDTGVYKDQSESDYMCDGGVLSSYHGDSGISSLAHGPSMISIISNKMNTSIYCIVSYKVFKDNETALKHIVKALNYAYDHNIKYINMSLNGASPKPSEREVISRLLRVGATITVAAGNDGSDLDKNCNAFPSCYNLQFKSKFMVVVSTDNAQSNYGSVVTKYLPSVFDGTPETKGTSTAAAQEMNRIISGTQSKRNVFSWYIDLRK